MVKQTALYEAHLSAKGKMVEFAGYLLPINYEKGIIFEHHQVRENVGVFDVSHMGEILVKGEKAKEFLEKTLTNSIGNLVPGKIRYTIMCYPDGGCVDDLLVYCFSDEEYFLVVNASNKDKDFQYLLDLKVDGVSITDKSDEYSQVAIQGPNSEKVMRELGYELPEKYFTFITTNNLIISKTGYTGESGYEVYGPAIDIIKLWDSLLACGVEPCGLGCRDTLRFEAGLPLYGHEISANTNPLEANLGFAVKLNKDFIGKEALEKSDNFRSLIGLKLIDRGIAREGSEVYCGEQLVGVVTTGTMSPTLNIAIANALVKKDFENCEEFVIDVRGRRLKAERVALPYYNKEK